MNRKEKFIATLTKICEDDSHGYDQRNRWYPDFDCSSLMYWCANKAGYNVPINQGYTGTMLRDFTKAGWKAVPYTNQNLFDIPGGCIMLNVGSHTEGVVKAGLWGGAHINEKGGVVGGQTGDQTGREISLCTPYHYAKYPNDWDYILYPPDEKEDDMPTVKEIWDYNIEGKPAKERLYLCNVMDYDRTDYSGRGKEATPNERLAWMAKKQEDMQKSIDNLKMIIDDMYDKILEIKNGR